MGHLSGQKTGKGALVSFGRWYRGRGSVWCQKCKEGKGVQYSGIRSKVPGREVRRGWDRGPGKAIRRRETTEWKGVCEYRPKGGGEKKKPRCGPWKGGGELTPVCGSGL